MHLSINQTIQALTQQHPLQPYWQNLLTHIQSQALDIALQEQLFEKLTTFKNVQDISSEQQWHPENTAYFLQLLASMQLVEIEGTDSTSSIFYKNSELTQRYFVQNSDEFCGHSFLFRHQVIKNISNQLRQNLSPDFKKHSIPKPDIANAWANAAQRQIAQEQKAVSVNIAKYLSTFVGELHSAQQLLDIGGGAGLIAMYFAEQFPQLHCTLMEFPEVINAVQDEFNQHPEQHRLHTLSGDLTTIDFEQSYDVIWCSSVLHFVKDHQQCLAKIYAALKPSGVLICAHSEIDIHHLDADVQSYYLNMRIQGNFVPLKGDLVNALQNLGCRDLQCIDDVQFPVAPLNVIIARK